MDDVSFPEGEELRNRKSYQSERKRIGAEIEIALAGEPP